MHSVHKNTFLTSKVFWRYSTNTCSISSQHLFKSEMLDKSGFFFQFLTSPVPTRKHQYKFQEILPRWSHSDVSWVHFFCAAHRQTRDSRFRALLILILILLSELTVMLFRMDTNLQHLLQTHGLTFIRVYDFQHMLHTFTNTSAL